MQAVSAGKGKEATRRLDGDDQHAMRHSSVVNLAESRDCSVRTTKQTRKETQPEGAQSVQNAMLMMGVAGQRPGSPDARGSLQHAGAADALLELEELGKSTYVINSLYAALIECGMLRMYVECFVSLGCSVARVACLVARPFCCSTRIARQVAQCCREADVERPQFGTRVFLCAANRPYTRAYCSQTLQRRTVEKNVE